MKKIGPWTTSNFKNLGKGAGASEGAEECPVGQEGQEWSWAVSAVGQPVMDELPDAGDRSNMRLKDRRKRQTSGSQCPALWGAGWHLLRMEPEALRPPGWKSFLAQAHPRCPVWWGRHVTHFLPDP